MVGNLLCWGYNTNGFPYHRFDQVCYLLRSMGYQAVAITLDYHLLNPWDPLVRQQAIWVKQVLNRYGLRCVIETGARYILDAWRKHEPTLLSASASRRLRRYRFLQRAVDLAEFLRADAVSFWAGRAPRDDAEVLWQRLVEGCRALVDYAAGRSVRLAFEPEPGMFVERLDEFERLRDAVKHPLFGLCLDVGHVHCLDDGEPDQAVRRYANCLYNVHLEDMRRGVHEHLIPGEGEMDLALVVEALSQVGYPFGVYLELSRDGHRAVEAAQRALRYLLRSPRSGGK